MAHVKAYSSLHLGLQTPSLDAAAPWLRLIPQASGRPASSYSTPSPDSEAGLRNKGSLAHALSCTQPVLVGVLAVFFLPLGFSSPPHSITPAPLASLSSQHPVSSARVSHSFSDTSLELFSGFQQKPPFPVMACLPPSVLLSLLSMLSWLPLPACFFVGFFFSSL